MPPGSMQYTLVGLSPELDWRPLRFVKPIPQYWVCSACGLLRTRSAIFPCMHTLCESCYVLSAQGGAFFCPLDGCQWEDGDVELKDIDADKLLNREVMCWNESSDCGAVLPASEVARHFQLECKHHSVRCPKCSASLRCSAVCTHLRSECCATSTVAESARAAEFNLDSQTALVESFKGTIEGQVREVKAILDRLLAASGANTDRLNEVAHGVNESKEAQRELWQGIRSLKDAVREEVYQETSDPNGSQEKCWREIVAFRQETKEGLIASRDKIQILSNRVHTLETTLKDEVSKEIRQSLGKVPQAAGGMAEAKEALKEANKTVDRVVKMLHQSGRPVSICEFFVKSVNSLAERATKHDWIAYDADEVYLRGYCMSPGVCIVENGGTITLHAWFRMHKGDLDDVLQWPFKQTLVLRVVHPNGGAERVLTQFITSTLRSCQKPEASINEFSYYSQASLHLDGLISDGYVENDQLRVKFQLLR